MFSDESNILRGAVTYVAPLITKKDTNIRTAIGPDQRLSLTLRYLATGTQTQVLQLVTESTSPLTVGRAIEETCLGQIMLSCITAPTSDKEWIKISDEFEKRWNFPHAFGALDRKHVVMFAPARASSAYFNCKHMLSIVSF